jgi:hypothetical protein
VLDDLMKSMYSASCSTPPIAPDLVVRALRFRQVGRSAVECCLRVGVSSAWIIVANRALGRDEKVSYARETTGTRKIAV